MLRRRIFTGVSLAAITLCVSPLFAQKNGGPHITAPTHTDHASTAGKAPSTHLTFIQRIDANPRLVARLQPLVPSGMTLDQAAAGFKNQGQFIAALHVSKNLNIPFDQLKTEMTGTDHDKLGTAIHELKPTVDAKAAAKTAEQEAKADIKATQPAKPDTDNDADDKK
jgi:hypothetical protein